MPTAGLRPDPEGDVPIPSAEGHPECLPRYRSVPRCAGPAVNSPMTHPQLLFLTVARLYLTGSSMSGLGCRSSDADLCLVLRGSVSGSSRSPEWEAFLEVRRRDCNRKHGRSRSPRHVPCLLSDAGKPRSYSHTHRATSFFQATG